MEKHQDESMKQLVGKLNRPKRMKSEQSNQQKALSQDCAKQTVSDPFFEERLQWLENLDSQVRQNFSG